jgi:hypothetical protein
LYYFTGRLTHYKRGRMMKEGMLIICTDHPEWGTWGVIKEYDIDTFEIRGDSGERILFESEFKRFWKEVTP